MTDKESKTGISTLTVTKRDTALAHGSGDLEVLATPALVALMENAALKAAAELLPPGSTTVGTEIRASHTRATPVGGRVEARAVLEHVDGRKLDFSITARDEAGEVGTAFHSRFIVDRERFMAKVRRG